MPFASTCSRDVVDEQSGFQQVGSDLQGHDDDGRRDRSSGSSQRDHRAQRAQLPDRNSKEVKGFGYIIQGIATISNFLTGDSSCR